jgi:pimeloyl-ACP methyl ester carboxylesterase
MEETIYIRNQGADMPAFIRGNGASEVFIIFLHGGPGGNSLKYRTGSYSKTLEEKYAMVYWDQRGQGNSHGHLENSEMSIDLMVEDTYALVKTLKQHYGQGISVFLLGHSWGGTLGTSFLLKDNYQSELKGWIEVGGAHDLPLVNSELIIMFNDVGALEIAAGRNVDTWNEMINYANSIDLQSITLEQTLKLNSYARNAEGLIATLNPKGNAEFDGELVFGPNSIAAAIANAHQLPTSLFDELLETSLTSELHNIHIPTLLQWGRYDFKVPPAIGETALAELGTSDKQMIYYEKSGHSPMRHEPEQFAHDIINFVELYK